MKNTENASVAVVPHIVRYVVELSCWSLSRLGNSLMLMAALRGMLGHPILPPRGGRVSTAQPGRRVYSVVKHVVFVEHEPAIEWLTRQQPR